MAKNTLIEKGGLGRSQSMNRVRSIASSVGAYTDLSGLQDAYGSDFVKGLNDRQMAQLLQMDEKYVRSSAKYGNIKIKDRSAQRSRKNRDLDDSMVPNGLPTSKSLFKIKDAPGEVPSRTDSRLIKPNSSLPQLNLSDRSPSPTIQVTGKSDEQSRSQENSPQASPQGANGGGSLAVTIQNPNSQSHLNVTPSQILRNANSNYRVQTLEPIPEDSLYLQVRKKKDTLQNYSVVTGKVKKVELQKGLRQFNGSRVIHQDGLEQLEIKLAEKEKKKQYQIMENRIKRLEFEEQRTIKKTQEAERRAQEMLQNRQRHQEWQEHRRQFAQYNEEQKNQAHQAAQQRRFENYSIKNQNAKFDNIMKATVKSTHMQNKAENEERRLTDERIRFGQNQARAHFIQEYHAEKTYENMGQKLQMMVDRHQEYENEKSNKKFAIQQMDEKMRQMEEREKMMVDQLATTTQKQEQMQRKLKEVVSQGKNYYQKVAKNRYDVRWDKPKVLLDQDQIDQAGNFPGRDTETTMQVANKQHIKNVDYTDRQDSDAMSASNPQNK